MGAHGFFFAVRCQLMFLAPAGGSQRMLITHPFTGQFPIPNLGNSHSTKGGFCLRFQKILLVFAHPCLCPICPSLIFPARKKTTETHLKEFRVGNTKGASVRRKRPTLACSLFVRYGHFQLVKKATETRLMEYRVGNTKGASVRRKRPTLACSLFVRH